VEDTCFVIQPFDEGIYDQLFKDVFDPAITAAGLKPYRVDQDPSSAIPIEAIEEGIKRSAVCFAEITTDNPNVWFELGYAIALGKPICLVSNKRSRFPFDVQHRKIIIYKKQSAPSDFALLQEKITASLKARVIEQGTFESNKEAAVALSSMPETEGLKPHELLALTIAMQDHFTGGISPHELQRKVQKGFAVPAGSLSIIGLKRKGLIEIRMEQNYNNDPYSMIQVSEKGEEWLMNNQEKLNLKLFQEEPEQDESSSVEITNEDIPF
jgi:hypothetical protein